MSDYENPYQSPETQIIPEASQSAGVELSVKMLNHLNETSPWLRFIGILGYIGCGIFVLIGFLSSFGLFTLSESSNSNFFGGMTALALAVIYIPVGVLLFFPAHFIFTFGQKIRSYRFTNSIEDLEAAFQNNKSLWKFLGILSIIQLAIVPLIIIGAVIFGVISALGLLNIF